MIFVFIYINTKQHQKVIEKGKPDDVPIGIKGKKVSTK